MESIKELRKICQKKGGADYYIRSYSIYLTKLFLYTKLTPNQITILWIFIGLIGTSLFFIGNYLYNVIAGLLIFLALSLDFVDGEVARYRKKQSWYGEFLDWVGTWFISLLAIFAITINSFLTSGDFWILIVGGFTFIGYGMKELLPLKFTNIFSNSKKKSNKNKLKIGLLHKLYSLFRKVFFVEYFFEAILVFSILNLLPIFLILYGISFNILWITKVVAESIKYKRGL